MRWQHLLVASTLAFGAFSVSANWHSAHAMYADDDGCDDSYDDGDYCDVDTGGDGGGGYGDGSGGYDSGGNNGYGDDSRTCGDNSMSPCGGQVTVTTTTYACTKWQVTSANGSISFTVTKPTGGVGITVTCAEWTSTVTSSVRPNRWSA
jgi:hypothetical protein